MKLSDITIGETYVNTKGEGFHIVGKEKLRQETHWVADPKGRTMLRCFNGDVIAAAGLYGTKDDLAKKLLADAEAKQAYLARIKAAGLDTEGNVVDPGAFMAAFVNYLNACEGKVKLNAHNWLKEG